MLYMNGFYNVGTSFNIKIVLACGIPYYVCSTSSTPKSVESPFRHIHIHLHILLLITSRSAPEIFPLLMGDSLSQMSSKPDKRPYHPENHASGSEYSDYITSEAATASARIEKVVRVKSLGVVC